MAEKCLASLYPRSTYRIYPRQPLAGSQGTTIHCRRCHRRSRWKRRIHKDYKLHERELTGDIAATFQNSIIYKGCQRLLLAQQTQINQQDTDRVGFYPSNMRRGSSMYSLTLTRKVTASRPSKIRWSYVRARYIICLRKVSSTRRSSMQRESYRADFNLAVDGHGLVLDGVKSQNS